MTAADAMGDPIDPDVQFFQLVERIGRRNPDATPTGSTAAVEGERLRFRSNPTLAFPAGEVASVTPHAALPGVLDVTVNLIGLYGPSSPLPTMFTERVLDQEADGAVAPFFDLFNHRLTSLLFLIWKHYRHDLRYESGGRDPLSKAAGSLFGVLPLDAEQADATRPTFLPYAGLLAMGNRSADTVARVLGHFLDLPCHVEEFVARRIAIPPDSRFELGTPRGLGVDTILGESVADVTGECHIWIGPMPFTRYLDLLPDGADHARTQQAIAFIINEPLSHRLGLIVEADAAPDWALGTGKLGWTTWATPDRLAPVANLL